MDEKLKPDRTDQDVQDFSKKIELHTMKEISFTSYEMLPLCGFGVAIAFNKYIALNEQIWSASHVLLNAYKTVHKGVLHTELDNSMWERTMYLKNAIVTYNSCVDYIYSILYFYFDLYIIIGNKQIIKREDIITISKSICNEKMEKINCWLSNDPKTVEFSRDFSNYREVTKELRNKANEIKHRGGYWIEGNSWQRKSTVNKKINGIDLDITAIVAPIELDIEAEIESLVFIHQQTFIIQIVLYKLLNFTSSVKHFLGENHISSS